MDTVQTLPCDIYKYILQVATFVVQWEAVIFMCVDNTLLIPLYLFF